MKPGSTTDIAQLARDLIKSKMGPDFQISYELWARFAIWVRGPTINSFHNRLYITPIQRATVKIFSGNDFWDRVDIAFAKIRQKALQQFPGPDQRLQRQQSVHL